MSNKSNILEAIKSCTCSFTTCRYGIDKLKKEGFIQLKLEDTKWNIENNQGYYINVYDSTLFAFKTGWELTGGGDIRIAAAHTDQPALYIKPNPEIKSGRYGKLNIEIYGGPILNTWLDRPLSAAGKVVLRSDDIFKPEVKIIDLNKPFFVIPNLAIHMNRDVNKGVELNRQNDMMPLVSMVEEELNKKDFFIEFLAEHLNVNKKEILDFELYLYNYQEGCTFGINDEFIIAPRLDNITSVEACLVGLLSSKREQGINMIALYDNEEIGSRTKQGADSVLLSEVIKKIYSSIGIEKNIYESYLVSLDVAHGIHPNKIEKSDITNQNYLNNGIVIKRASSQVYATDSETIGVMEQLAESGKIKYQKFASRSDVTMGSTLGSIVNKYIPIRAVDIGVPILAMHSSMETMGIKDQKYLEKFVKIYFETGR